VRNLSSLARLKLYFQTAVTVLLTLFRRQDASMTAFSQDVTGCIRSGPPNNDALVLWNIVQRIGSPVDAGPDR
jgi:hypothetical protein